MVVYIVRGHKIRFHLSSVVGAASAAAAGLVYCVAHLYFFGESLFQLTCVHDFILV